MAHTYMYRALREVRLAMITVLVCFEPVFEVGLKGAIGRAFSYCTWYVVPDVTALNRHNRLSKSRVSVRYFAISPGIGSGGSATANFKMTYLRSYSPLTQTPGYSLSLTCSAWLTHS